jgi:hypothetical protein
MESLLKSVTLTQDVVRVLDEIRAGAENALYGAESDKSQELFTKHVVSLVEGAGLPVLQTMHYRWFLRELARLWRTRTGRDLAFHLELCIRKWVGLGLEPRTLQFLVCEAHERLKAANSGSSHPPISPITEDSSESVRNSNLRESVESVDNTPPPSSAESADATMSDAGTLPGCMSGPRPPITPIAEDPSKSIRDPDSNLRVSVESVDARSPRTAKDAKTAKAEPDSAAVTEQSAESAKSADVQARIPPPPITPIQEDHGFGLRNPAPNLRKSVESVDDTPDSSPVPSPQPPAPEVLR